MPISDQEKARIMNRADGIAASSNLMLTKEDFVERTFAGKFARRHSIIRKIDDLLEKYYTLSLNDQYYAAMELLAYCNDYEEMLDRERRSSKRQLGIWELRRRATIQIEKLKYKRTNVNRLINVVRGDRFKALKSATDLTRNLNLKEIHASELIEVVDYIQHRAGHRLEPFYNTWKAYFQKTISFWDYLENELIKNPQAKAKIYNVRYLSENERRAYRIFFNGDRLMQGEGPQAQLFDTKRLTINKPTVAASQGKAIFVMSSDDVIYSNGSLTKPVVAEDGKGFDFNRSGDIFHHSSFLGGRPIKFGGEWIVENGRIVIISPSSGHYRPPAHLLVNFLKHLARLKFNLQKIVIEWTIGGRFCYYNAADIMIADNPVIDSEPYAAGIPLPILTDKRNPQSRIAPPPLPSRNAPPPTPARNRNAPPPPGAHRPAPQPPTAQNNAPAQPKKWAPVQTTTFKR